VASVSFRLTRRFRAQSGKTAARAAGFFEEALLSRLSPRCLVAPGSSRSFPFFLNELRFAFGNTSLSFFWRVYALRPPARIFRGATTVYGLQIPLDRRVVRAAVILPRLNFYKKKITVTRFRDWLRKFETAKIYSRVESVSGCQCVNTTRYAPHSAGRRIQRSGSVSLRSGL
jgi:hypothetical protein